MKNKIDYIYEYSDLNLFQTRVLIKTGDYAGIILEFGASKIINSSFKPSSDFIFDYTLYHKPERFKSKKLKGDVKFESYLSELLLSIIQTKKNDKKEHAKLMEVKSSKIKIDDSFYIKE